MFPALHEEVLGATSSDLPFNWVLKGPNNDRGAIQKWSTYVMGTFRCKNGECTTKGWGSKKVAILIRGYTGHGYNAVVFNQHCKTCDALGIFTLDKSSYIERVAYRIQIWAGVQLERPAYAGKTGPPHREDLCEGCKRGLCQQSSTRAYY
jgi:hypothetical protein